MLGFSCWATMRLKWCWGVVVTLWLWAYKNVRIRIHGHYTVTFFAFFCIFKTHKKNNEFTGVWPEKENCGGSSFDESQVQDLLSDMKVYWLSCPEFPNTDTEFWTHEWSKHGSCSGMSQHEYFSDGLALRSKYASLCDGQSGNSCSLDCDGYDGPCRNWMA